MEIILLVARLVLAAVFGLAGSAKLADPSGTRKAILGFGLPELLGGPVTWLLPVVEIVIALALIPVGTAWWGAAAAALLLLLFSAAIGINLARGQAPDCHCFGQLHSKPVSWPLFARNIALALMAGFIVTKGQHQPGLTAVNLLADLSVGHIANLAVSTFAAAVMVVATIYLRGVFNHQTAILTRLDAMEKLLEEYAPPPVEHEEATHPGEGLPVGAPAPDFALTSVGGLQVSLRDLLGYGKPVLLLFVSPSCAPCATILQDVKGWERDNSDMLTIALLSKGSIQDNEERVAKYGARHLLMVGDSDVTESYEAKWTPAAVMISSEGRIASHNAYGEEAIKALIAGAVSFSAGSKGHSASANGHGLQITVGKSTLKVGDPAPHFSLPDMDGKAVNTKDLLGRDTLLLFWNPSCPYCTAMSEDVRSWEEDPPPRAPRLVFVASGDQGMVKDARDGFESLFLHDHDFQLGMLFGTNSTPSALLLDSDGRIASSIARGSSNVMLLAGVRKPVTPVLSSSA